MFAWWWLIIAFFAGAFVGMILTAIAAANRSDLGNARKWEDDE